MNIKLTGIHLEITPALRTHIDSKFERVTRHIDSVINVSVTLSVEKLVHKAEVDLHLAGKDIHVEATNSDMYVAIDSLIDKLDRQVLKYKEKNNEHRVVINQDEEI